ncbi:MAG: hypothetical protein LBK59_10435 [Bifidobacteriaceae bacterium]|nr:hypothetical protein [Bifidobacteriaceae bacterium]
MRTTLTLDDDVFYALKQRARAGRKPLGAVASELVRAALTAVPENRELIGANDPLAVRGFRPLPKRGGVVTNELINRLREEAGE